MDIKWSLLTAAVVLIKDGQVLLLKRQNTGIMDGKWALPWGKVDPGESMIQACIRETKEEIGLDLSKNNIDRIILWDDSKSFFDTNSTLAFYGIVRNYEWNIENKEPEKCKQIKWFPIQDLPKNIVDYLPSVIKAIRNQKSYFEKGFEN